MKVTTSTTGVRGAAHGVRARVPAHHRRCHDDRPALVGGACLQRVAHGSRSFAAADVSAHHRGDTASNQRVPLLGRLWHCVHVGVYAAPLNYPPPPTTICRGSTFCSFAGGGRTDNGAGLRKTSAQLIREVFAVHFPEFAPNNNVCTASTKT